MKWKKSDLYYMAGFIDGEGCIGIEKVNRPNSPIYRVRVSMTSTTFSILKWFQQLCGGNLCSAIRSSPKHKPAWIWSLHNTAAVNFVRQIRDHLKIKQKQAALASEFYATCFEGQIFHKISQAEWKQRERYKQKMHKLNKKGREIA